MKDLLDLSLAGLCGRDKEIYQLQECVNTVIDSESVETVSIEGEAGAGKTLLVQHVWCVAHAERQDNALVSGTGKFEESSQEPFRALVSCFESVVTRLLESAERRFGELGLQSHYSRRKCVRLPDTRMSCWSLPRKAFKTRLSTTQRLDEV